MNVGRKTSPDLPNAPFCTRERTWSVGRKSRKDGRNKASVEGKQSGRQNQQRTEETKTATRQWVAYPGSSAITAGNNRKPNRPRREAFAKILRGRPRQHQTTVHNQGPHQGNQANPKKTARPHLCSTISASSSMAGRTRPRLPAIGRCTAQTRMKSSTSRQTGALLSSR